MGSKQMEIATYCRTVLSHTLVVFKTLGYEIENCQLFFSPD